MKKKSATASHLKLVARKIETARVKTEIDARRARRWRSNWQAASPEFRARFPKILAKIERLERDVLNALAPETWLYCAQFELHATPAMRAWRDAGFQSRAHLPGLSDAELALLEQIANDHYAPNEPPQRAR